MTARFLDRRDAGRSLSKALARYQGRSDLVVLALPRGGVPVGYEVARALGAPLDVYVVRKLGAPWNEELALGAIGSFGAEVENADLIEGRVPREVYERIRDAERVELARRERAYRGDRAAPVVADRTVIVVDDGLATGATMRAAVAGIRTLGPRAIVVAVPVGDAAVVGLLREQADDVVCARIPRALQAVGSHYEDFSQTTDEEVRVLLAEAGAR